MDLQTLGAALALAKGTVLPAVDSGDAGKVLAVDSSGAWDAANTTSSVIAVSGSTISIDGTDYDMLDGEAVHHSEQALTGAQQTQARANIGAARSSAEGLVCTMNSLVPYGYETQLINQTIKDVSGTTSSGVTMSRIGTRYVLNANLSSNSTPIKILLQEAPISYTSGFPSGQTPQNLVNGHTYRLHTYHASGTATNNIYASFYHAGTSMVNTATTIGNHAFVDLQYNASTYDNGISICLYIKRKDTGNALSNYTVDIVLEDITYSSGIEVSGSTPEITALAGMRYVCTAESVTSLSFTPSSTGVCSVRFVSGATPTNLTLPNTVKMPDWWTGVAANTTYDIRVRDGVYADVEVWPDSAQALSQPVARYLGVKTGTVTAVTQSYVDASIATDSKLYLYPYGLAVLKLFMAVKSAIPTDGVAINVAKVSVAPIVVITQTLSNPFGEGAVAMQIDTSGNLKVSTRGTSKPSGSWGIYEAVICYPIAPYVAT